MKDHTPNCCNRKTLNKQSLDNLTFFLNTISDKNRLRIICVLQKGERCVCDICKHLSLSQNLVSYHLNILEKTKIISSDKRGLKVFYKINKRELNKNIKSLDKFIKIKL